MNDNAPTANFEPNGPADETRTFPPAPGPTDDRPLPEVEGYEILGVCGHGAMGVVYRARQLRANRQVALKVIRAAEYATPVQRLRFRIEIEAVARLQHPNIVQLHEVGETRGHPYFSLEYCDGGTLAERLKERPPPREAAELIETLARAMHYAHLRGVVHRDLKPSNVLVAGPGRVVKISDFGLAKRTDADAHDATQSGAIMGTAAYMAPEQAAGNARDTGPAADVYALGAMLYECLTGRTPFEGTTTLAVLERVLHEEPVRPSRRAPRVPTDLDTICMKCLEKEPAKRYASAEELAEDLRRFRAGEPIRARPVGALERATKWSRRNPAGAALLAVVALALVALAVLSVNLFEARNDANAKRQRAEDKEAEVRKEADKAQRARDFLIDIFRMSDRKGAGGTVTARDILDNADRRLATEFAEQPELRADLEAAIESVYASLGTAGPQAMILEAKGTVELTPAKPDKRRAVQQTLLFLGDRLRVGPDGDVRVVFLQDFHKERLNPGSEVTISRRGCRPATAVRERTDDILLSFVRVPKGTFYMGWGAGDGTVRRVTVAADFDMAAHTVTQFQWQAVTGANPSFFSRSGAGQQRVKDVTDDELRLFPVENVSWLEVQEFIQKLNEKERGRGYLYRLPTEFEWEYACRNAATTEKECSFYFYTDVPTNDLSSFQANFYGERPFGNAPKGPDLNRPSRVGAYPPNKLGLCDMHGNVQQWCSDLWDPRITDRLYRGGGWNTDASIMRAGLRSATPQDQRRNTIGFRLVRVPAP